MPEAYDSRTETYLAIDGSGTLYTHGNGYGAGIGGDYLDTNKAGHITINGGTITALGYAEGAGIGAGRGTGCGTVVINGGTVNAYGGYTAPGIGQGTSCPVSDAGTVTINGGTVNAYGGDARSGDYAHGGTGGGGAGIGGGSDGACGTITIAGGVVTAVGGDRNTDYPTRLGGAGIGGGCRNLAGSVTFNGGVTYACRGVGMNTDPEDLGSGESGSTSVSVSISGSAAVIAENDSFISALSTVTHTHKRYDDTVEPMLFTGGVVYGITADPSWVNADGGYFILYHLYYNANGGTGSVPASGDPIHYRTPVTVESGSPLSRAGYFFEGWNTLPSGSGTAYPAGSELILDQDTMLYAQWSEVPPTGDSSSVPLWILMASAAILLGAAVIVVWNKKRAFMKR